MSQRVLQIICTGLATSPNSDTSNADDDCGMMGIATQIAPDPIIKAFGWLDGSPDEIARRIRGLIQEVKPTKIIAHAHSFGNNIVVFFARWLEVYHNADQKIDLVIGYDPCREIGYGIAQWTLPQQTVGRFRTFYQRGGRPFGVSGTPFDARADGTGENTDVTGWTNPSLAHVTIGGYTGIIMDDRVRSAVIREGRDVINGGDA